MRRAFSALVLAAIALAATPVDAHNTTVPSRIRRTSLATEGDEVVAIGGVVASRRAACEAGRKVVVTYLDEDLNVDDYGVTFTDRDGDWKIEEDGPTLRRYTFTVRRKVVGRPGHRKTCLPDRISETLN
jgi:hypothetical protein